LFYGWYVWKFGDRQKHELSVTRTSSNLLFILGFIAIIATAGIGMIFRYKTNASLPFVDAFTASLSLVSQWMVAKKKIENWIIWIIADIIYIGMYLYKHLYLTSLLYFIFIILAVIGWQQWKKDLKATTATG